jgi:methylated-DNA-[protein]-cysteine S-methyltransferase
MLHLTLGTYESPLGEILLVTDSESRLRALEYSDHQTRLHRLLREHYGDYKLTPGAVPATLVGRLDRYFQGDLTALEDVEVVTEGTAMQKKVWAGLRAIPAGQTKSYGQLAKDLGLNDPLAAREIGEINNANPVAIVVPCHRVIAKDGKLKGYAGGIHRKKWLLEHEEALPGSSREPAMTRLPGL